MADLTITTSQVLSSAGATTEQVTAGEAIAIGKSCYRAANGKWYLAQADGDPIEAGVGTGTGVAITGAAAADQDFLVQRDGDLVLGAGAAPAVGTVYCVSATAGGICPYSDLTSTKRVTILGVGKTGNILAMGRGVNASGAAIP